MSLAQITPYLPHLQAMLNTTAALLLAAGYYQIKRGNRSAHKRFMTIALLVSAVFLASYLTYTIEVGYTPFTGEGIIRPFYFSLLASHVILAAIILPMVLTTAYLAASGRLDRHLRLARWTLPLWFYVSASGVIIHLLCFHIYTPDI